MRKGRGGWGGPRKRMEGEGKGGRVVAPHSEILDPPLGAPYLEILATPLNVSVGSCGGFTCCATDSNLHLHTPSVLTC
jgi:hypothetical protein